MAADLEIAISGRVATVTLARGDVRNALSDAFFGKLVDAIETLDRDTEIGCVVIAGQPKFFSAGADVAELAGLDPTEVLLGPRAQLWRALRAFRVPLVAAVSGHCLGGGCELALSCDLIVASSDASFGMPETSIGLVPGGGGSQLLVRLVGRAVAADMILTGRRLSATEAHQMGLVARLCEPSECLNVAREAATTIAARPRVAQLLAKRALNLALETPFSSGAVAERALFEVALSTDEARGRLAEFATRATRAGAADG